MSRNGVGRWVKCSNETPSHFTRFSLELAGGLCLEVWRKRILVPSCFEALDATFWRRSYEVDMIMEVIYPTYFTTRKSMGLMTRKLSVTWSRYSHQFLGTSRVRKVIVLRLNARKLS